MQGNPMLRSIKIEPKATFHELLCVIHQKNPTILKLAKSIAILKLAGLLSMNKNPTMISIKVFDVTLKVSAKISDVFRQRNHLPHQKNTLQKDGSLLVTSTISTYTDIDPEIKSWLPHIEILEPMEYRQRFREELRVYLQLLHF